MIQKIPLNKKLSFQGIFLIYNFNEIKKSPPFRISLIAAIFYFTYSILTKNDQLKFAESLIEKTDSLFPNLIGFSLGGYAIIVAFGNTDFLKKIAKSGFPYYEKLNAIFAFSILLQTLVLFISVFASFIQTATKQFVFFYNIVFYYWVNISFNTLMLFFVIWALALIPFVVSNIFIFGETHHELLRLDNVKEKTRKRYR